VFFSGYGISRMLVELFFRQPDAHIGYLVGGTSMGFWLSVPVLLIGIGFLTLAIKTDSAHRPDGSSDDRP
jgi:phosphatidylglycerol:prolipoprotein diacylglycerol transferase